MSRKGRGKGLMAKRGATSATKVTAATVKAAATRALKVISDLPEEPPTALNAVWPEPVLELDPGEREQRVRRGAETVLLDTVDDEGRRRGARGFVRAVLKVPIGSPNAQTYGVFVEVEREGYQALRRGFDETQATEVWGSLATRLPLLEDAYGTRVCVVEDGSDLRARIIKAEHDLLVHGPQIGPA